MDYKYIEQLLERYWACETSVEEEQILRAFFRQKEVPAHLLPYKSLFAYEDAAADLHLGEDFDERILAQVERPSVKARRLPMRRRMMPLFKAAAVVAVMLSLGTVAQHSFNRSRLQLRRLPGHLHRPAVGLWDRLGGIADRVGEFPEIAGA